MFLCLGCRLEPKIKFTIGVYKLRCFYNVVFPLFEILLKDLIYMYVIYILHSPPPQKKRLTTRVTVHVQVRE